MNRRRTDSTVRRLAAGVLAIVVTTALAALAGVGLARGSISAAQYQYGKVTVCHKTKSKKHPEVTITVSRSGLAAHLKHGDTEGACPKASAPGKSKEKGSEKKAPPAASKGPEKSSEKPAEKKPPEKSADPPAKEKEKEKGEKEKGEKEHGGENGGGQGNGNGGGGEGGGKSKGK